MKLYQIHAIGNPGWDAYVGFVVRARDAGHAARIIKKEHPWAFFGSTFDDMNRTYRVTELTADGPAEVILDSYQAG